MRFETLLAIFAVTGSFVLPVAAQQQGKGQGKGKGQNQQAEQQAAQQAAAKGKGNQNQGKGAQNQGNNNNDQNAGGNAALALDPANVNEGSQADGTAAGAEAGQAASLTDDANFINFCTGKTLTNGLQNKQGSCNGVVMGDIPPQAKMVSSILISPQPGEDLPANQDFKIQVQVDNLQAGSFTNPDNTYYTAPQALNQGGTIIGHTHVTVQDMGGSMTPQQPLNAMDFVFFKGINDDGNGQGLLAADVTGGLEAGTYRVCTLSSSSNHQPVIMPVAQRGAQDDCTKFTVGGGGGGGGGGNNNQNQGKGGNNQNAAAAAAAAAQQGKNAKGNGAAQGKGAAQGQQAQQQAQQAQQEQQQQQQQQQAQQQDKQGGQGKQGKGGQGGRQGQRRMRRSFSFEA